LAIEKLQNANISLLFCFYVFAVHGILRVARVKPAARATPPECGKFENLE
jgi:hypothetical protein